MSPDENKEVHDVLVGRPPEMKSRPRPVVDLAQFDLSDVVEIVEVRSRRAVNEYLAAGYPDAGGSVEKMAELNAAIEAVRAAS